MDSSRSDSSDSDGEKKPSSSKAKAKGKKPQRSISDTIGRWQSSQLKKVPGPDNRARQLFDSLSSLPQATSPLKKAQKETTKGLKSKSSKKAPEDPPKSSKRSKSKAAKGGESLVRHF